VVNFFFFGLTAGLTNQPLVAGLNAGAPLWPMPIKYMYRRANCPSDGCRLCYLYVEGPAYEMFKYARMELTETRQILLRKLIPVLLNTPLMRFRSSAGCCPFRVATRARGP
jgi:hypothetical protein